MASLLETHHLVRSLKGPPRHVTATDRLDALEQAVATATGRTVDDLRADARRQANERRSQTG